MSVLIPDLEVFALIQRKINTFQHHRVCDIDYSEILNMSEEQSKQFVIKLLTLNEMSYLARYREQKKPELSEFLQFNATETISTLQLLKYLKCIRYNIEMDTIERGYSGFEPFIEDVEMFHKFFDPVFKRLKNAIEELSDRVIAELTNYRELAWSELPKERVI